VAQRLPRETRLAANVLNIAETAPRAISALAVSTTSVPFGSVYLNDVLAKTVTLTNKGTAPITISSVTITGSNISTGTKSPAIRMTSRF